MGWDNLKWERDKTGLWPYFLLNVYWMYPRVEHFNMLNHYFVCYTKKYCWIRNDSTIVMINYVTKIVAQIYFQNHYFHVPKTWMTHSGYNRLEHEFKVARTYTTMSFEPQHASMQTCCRKIRSNMLYHGMEACCWKKDFILGRCVISWYSGFILPFAFATKWVFKLVNYLEW